MKTKIHPTLVPLTAVAFFLAFFVYARVLDPQAPFMDSLRFLIYFDDSERGVRSLWNTWNQGDHRGLLPQAVVYWNAKLFNLNLFGVTLLSGAILAITGFFLVREIYRTVDSASTFWLLTLLTFSALFSLSNWELYSVDVGAALFAKNLAFILYWIALTRALTSNNSTLRAGVIISGPAIVLLVAFGWSYAFVITSLLCIYLAGDRRLNAFKSAVYGSLLGALAIYVAAGNGVTQWNPGTSTPSFSNGVISIIYAAGSAFIGMETLQRINLPYETVLPLGVLLLVLAVLALYRFARNGGPMIPIALIIYGCLHAMAVAYARGRYSPPLAMAPRYYMDLSLAVVGIVWWMATLHPINFYLKLATRVLITLFAIGQILTTLDESRMAQHRHASFVKMKEATLRGAMTETDAILLQQNVSTTQQAAKIQRDRQLGPFKE